MKQWTHREVVEAAYEYMVNTMRIRAALKEYAGACPEQPDVIGFKQGRSYLMEIKVSRSDFLADARKPFRNVPELGMGNVRIYVCPKDLIKPNELPKGWGLAYIYPSGKIRAVVKWENDRPSTYKRVNGEIVERSHEDLLENNWFMKKNIDSEFMIMSSALGRLQYNHALTDDNLRSIPFADINTTNKRFKQE